MSTYLDCAATTPIDPRVAEVISKHMTEVFGDPTTGAHHHWGRQARESVDFARNQVAKVIGAKSDEVIFTGGATESNNLAILGLAKFGEASGRRHIISTQIEHLSVLEPIRKLAMGGFEVQLLAPEPGGFVNPERVRAALRSDTLLVSVMQANHVTGLVQPTAEIAEVMGAHQAYFHVDAAQGFGEVPALANPRIDLTSLSAHKMCGPKGVGALVARKRGSEPPALKPLHSGTGEERGLRPGTLPVPLIAGFGLAAELAYSERAQRDEFCRQFREEVLRRLSQLSLRVNGDSEKCLPGILNCSLAGISSAEAVRVLDGVLAISHNTFRSGRRCLNHVLYAMGFPDERIATALRFSWCHLTPAVDWDRVICRLQGLIRT